MVKAPAALRPAQQTLSPHACACHICDSLNAPGCAGRAPFKHLVYPLPEEGGLGVHLTLDLQGEAKFGPDVQVLTGLCPSCITSVRLLPKLCLPQVLLAE